MTTRAPKIFAAIIAVLIATESRATKYNVETVGDMFAIFLPAYALGMTMTEEDWRGTIQFAGSFGAALGTQIALKKTVNEDRPNGMDDESFPSGHAQFAFSGATFIHKRYGLKRAAAPYLMAGFVGFSRVDSGYHYWHDVAAAAAISGLWTWLLTEDYNVQIAPVPGGARFGFYGRF